MLTTSVATEVLIERFDFFLCFYHQKLIEALRKLNVKQTGPSLKALHMQLLKNSFLIPRTMIAVMPVILMGKSMGLNIEDLLDRNEKRQALIEMRMFQNPYLVSKLKLQIPFFYNRGMLDSCRVKKNDVNGNKI